ncbi:MAG: hypothetical protein OXF88_24215 [Rhodobacteraceae bacterium]|nr:hypothetical protein [Paracoccaceae bacterium]MCY4140086.1 hypothetical protein [Paracoccaceae bacterium]
MVHFFCTGLNDDRCLVERFGFRADGDIAPAPAETPRETGRCKTRRVMT